MINSIFNNQKSKDNNIYPSYRSESEPFVAGAKIDLSTKQNITTLLQQFKSSNNTAHNNLIRMLVENKDEITDIPNEEFNHYNDKKTPFIFVIGSTNDPLLLDQIIEIIYPKIDFFPDSKPLADNSKINLLELFILNANETGFKKSLDFFQKQLADEIISNDLYQALLEPAQKKLDIFKLDWIS